MPTVLSPTQESIVAEEVASGRFPSSEAVIDRALHALKHAELRRLIREGIDSIERGEGVETTVEEIYARVVARG